METEKKAKRIVSKGEYARIQSLRFGLFLSGLSLMLLGFSSAPLVRLVFHRHHYIDLNIFFTVGPVFATLLVIPAVMLIKKAQALNDNVVPITRANTADLPADESLVRASQEPVQEDQSILLRSAADTNQTPADQLLRPVPETITNGVK